jgi:hypothetical protein
VLLEIETDKAQMDVEAQDDGILAKIIVRGSTKACIVMTDRSYSKGTDRKRSKLAAG